MRVRRSTWWRMRAGAGVLGLVAALAVAGCGALGLDSGPADVTATTSAAPVAADATTTAAAVTVPVVGTGAGEATATPTPWESLTTTAATTTSAPPITAPTITRSVTFAPPASVTKPTVAAPTAVKSPPPDCYRQHTCRVQASAQAAGGTLEVVNESSATTTAIIFTPAGGEATSLAVARLTTPSAACSGSYCLVQGHRSGVYFGSLVLVKGGALRSVSGLASSPTALKLLSTPVPVVAGTYRFDSYGVLLDDAPVAARTWSIVGGALASTGCGQPYLYATPPTATSAQSGACSGTPQIRGYGPASANKLTSLSGFVTPSGNIQCGLLPSRLVCGAKQSSIKVPTCTVSTTALPAALRGLRVTVSTSGVVRKDDCIGYDLVGLPQTKIAYGRLAVAKGFVCEVQQDGVTCRVPSGRGFSLNRSSLTTF